MSWLFLFLSIIFIQCFAGINGEQTQTKVVTEWNSGFKGEIKLNLKNDVIGGWTIILSFSDVTPNLQMWQAKIVRNEDDKVYTLRNMPWNAQLSKGIFELSFVAQKSAAGGSAPTGKVVFIRGATIQPPTVDFSTPQPSTARPSSSAPSTNRPIQPPTVDFSTPQPSTARPSSSAPGTNHPSSTRPQTTIEASNKPTTAPQKPGKYDYGEVLKLSILFYEAQRSGKLPRNNRVEWREDSALDDQGGGNDLTGGWYDAGDYVKFGFPMASSATVLAWGLVEYKEAYEAAGQYDQMLKSIKWATDYFIKAHTKKEEFYGQVRRDLRLPTRIVHKIFNKQRY